MVDASVQTEKLTIDEFMRLYETEGPFEILDGERVQKMPPGHKHSRIALALLKALLGYLEVQAVGEVFHEAAFILPDSSNSNWVKGSRIPDLMFYRAEPLTAYYAEHDDEDDLPLALVPDLTVEIVSKNDSYQDVERKVQLYLQDGVQQVWVIKPKPKTVTIWAGDNWQILSIEDALEGGELLPGFTVQIATLFKKAGEK